MKYHFKMDVHQALLHRSTCYSARYEMFKYFADFYIHTHSQSFSDHNWLIVPT